MENESGHRNLVDSSTHLSNVIWVYYRLSGLTYWEIVETLTNAASNQLCFDVRLSIYFSH
jgi:hypothetical protein